MTELVVWTKRRGPDMGCVQCPHPITIGDKYVITRQLCGELGSFHEACARNNTPVIGVGQGMSNETRDEILLHMSRAFFACAWASYSEEIGPHYPAGCEIMDEMDDEIDPAATKAANELCASLEKQHGMPITKIFEKAVQISEREGEGDRPRTPEMFGHYVAMGAMGHGVGLHDALGRKAAEFVDEPSMEFSYYDLDPKKYPLPGDEDS